MLRTVQRSTKETEDRGKYFVFCEIFTEFDCISMDSMASRNVYDNDHKNKRLFERFSSEHFPAFYLSLSSSRHDR